MNKDNIDKFAIELAKTNKDLAKALLNNPNISEKTKYEINETIVLESI